MLHHLRGVTGLIFDGLAALVSDDGRALSDLTNFASPPWPQPSKSSRSARRCSSPWLCCAIPLAFGLNMSQAPPVRPLRQRQGGMEEA
jgi:hypothetical protein